MLLKLNPHLLAWRVGSKLALKGAPETRLLTLPLSSGFALISLKEGDKEEIFNQLNQYMIPNAEELFQKAQESQILIDSKYMEADWRLGPVVAAYLHGYHSDCFASVDQDRELVRQLLPSQPALLPEANPKNKIVQIPLPDQQSHLFNLLSKRRSRRNFELDGVVELQAITNLLFSGAGICGYHLLEGRGKLPFGPSPSPGSLNTYDEFLIAARVKGLSAGSYRYLPNGHCLELIKNGHWSLSELFGGQSWCDKASAAIILVAHLRRQTWKYQHPATLGAILAEAGHRVQNMLLAAEEYNLAAVSLGLRGIGAYSQIIAEEVLGLSKSWQIFPVHGMVLGLPDPLGDSLGYSREV